MNQPNPAIKANDQTKKPEQPSITPQPAAPSAQPEAPKKS